MPSQNYSPTDLEKVISNDEEINELHGDWMLVTRKKKSQTGPTHLPKNVTSKSNRFTSLSQLAHQVKPIQVSNKTNPRPKKIEASRVNKNHTETKRRRQDEESFDPTINFPNSNNCVGPILSLPTDMRVPPMTKTSTKSFAQPFNPATSLSTRTNTKATSTILPTLGATPQNQHSKNNTNLDENNHSAIPLINKIPTIQTHPQQTVYAEENMQVHGNNGDTHEESQDNIDNQNSSNLCDEDMAT